MKTYTHSFHVGTCGGFHFGPFTAEEITERVDFLHWWIAFLKIRVDGSAHWLWRKAQLAAEVEFMTLSDFIGRPRHPVFPHVSPLNVL